MKKILKLRNMAKMIVTCLAVATMSISCEIDDEVTLLSIEVTAQPTKKTYLVDETFDPAGMAVTATFSDESTSAVTIKPDMFTYDFSTIGSKTVTITYKSQSATVTGITVMAMTDNFTITTEAQLRELAKKVNGTGGFEPNSFEGQTFVLANDIILTGGNWEPIGRIAAVSDAGPWDRFPFEGTFDGNGKTVSNVIIKGNIYMSGFFGWVGENGHVKNLGVHIAEFDVAKSWGNANAGGIAGENDGKIENCFATGDIKAGTTWNAHVFVGGLVGINCGIITECYATGNVHAFTSANVYVGGLVGVTWGDPKILDGKAAIVNSYATGNVSGEGSRYMGGLVGDNGYSLTTTIVENCYATGNVSGTGSTIGGLVGRNPGKVTASFYDSETSGQSDTGKGAPKTTAAMKTQATFETWDFVAIWGIGAGKNDGYPYLLMK